MHPLQTFPTVRAALDRVAGTYFFCEGDARALDLAQRLAQAVGGIPRRLASGAKMLYHASAVLASNAMVALVDAALETGRQAGMDPREALEALAPLMRATLENIIALGPGKALTGPAVRGDLATVAGHLEALGGRDGRIETIYRVLSGQMVGLALRSGRLAPGAGEALERLLDGPEGPKRREHR